MTRAGTTGMVKACGGTANTGAMQIDPQAIALAPPPSPPAQPPQSPYPEASMPDVTIILAIFPAMPPAWTGAGLMPRATKTPSSSANICRDGFMQEPE